MKAYTSLEQSKKLAKILPPESADMYWDSKDCSLVKTPRIHIEPDCGANAWVLANGGVIAWSLAALLTLYPIVVGEDMGMYICWCNKHNLASRHYDNPVDACYEMILKLHEQKLL